MIIVTHVTLLSCDLWLPCYASSFVHLWVILKVGMRNGKKMHWTACFTDTSKLLAFNVHPYVPYTWPQTDTLQVSISGVFDSLLAILNLLPVESVNWLHFVSTFHPNFGIIWNCCLPCYFCMDISEWNPLVIHLNLLSFGSCVNFWKAWFIWVYT